MNNLHFFTSYKQRNQKEERKAAYQGDGKTIFRGRNGYDGSIYRQASTRTGEFKFLSLWSCMYLIFYRSVFYRTGDPHLLFNSHGNQKHGSKLREFMFSFKIITS